jgi:ZIP family zinc transporter
MSTRLRRLTLAHDYEPLPRASSELDRHEPPVSSWLHRLSSNIPGLARLVDPSVYVHYVTPRRKKRSVLRLVYWTLFSTPYLVLFLLLVAAVFFPSYTHRPAHYDELRRRSLQSDAPGRANIHNEKIFIAASIYEEEGALTAGAWGKAVLELVDLLGPQNVHLSIYENEADPVTQQSLANLKTQATCKTSPRR